MCINNSVLHFDDRNFKLKITSYKTFCRSCDKKDIMKQLEIDNINTIRKRV